MPSNVGWGVPIAAGITTMTCALPLVLPSLPVALIVVSPFGLAFGVALCPMISKDTVPVTRLTLIRENRARSFAPLSASVKSLILFLSLTTAVACLTRPLTAPFATVKPLITGVGENLTV